MRAARVGVVAAMVALVGVVSPATAQRTDGAASTRRPIDDDDRSSKWPVGGAAGAVPTAAELEAMARSARPAATTAGGAALIASASTDLVPCEEDPTFLCGTVPVPLDRRDPGRRMVDVHVEVFPHTGPQAEAAGAVFITCGGPGCSVTLFAKYGFAFFVLPELAETRDLVFVDQRGVGLSDVINCPALQAGGPLYRSSSACHDQLGGRADLYSTTDVADDLEDVRRALGYRRIDLFGGSYAGADMMTYAVRHTSRVRSVVLSSPAVVVGTDPFFPDAPEAMPGIVADVCGRSPACADANGDPAQSFARLARQLRREPVTGVGIDSPGVAHDMTVTENLLSNFIMYFNGAHFTGPGEITPAAAALRDGDPVPLLRLAADSDPANGFVSDLREFSAGHSLARNCVDGELPFDKSARKRVRRAQFAAAYAAEPDSYGVISKEAWAAPGYLGFQPSPCITRRWEDRPMYPAGTRVTGVPTLILGGEYDLPVPEAVARLAADVMVDSTYVGITAAGHDPQFYGDCGPELVQRFFRTREVGDTSCADEPAGGWWVPGSFPTRVGDAPRATQTGGPRAGEGIRRVVTVAAWTVLDSLHHNFFVPGDSVALRGGIVDFEPLDDGLEWTLEDAHFTEDVSVGGVIRGEFDPPIIDGEVSVQAPGRPAITMHLDALLFADDQMTISFPYRGGTATFTVPAY